MPTYLCHGFRWQRKSIRVFVVVQNLDDASPEWIASSTTSQALLESFYNLFDFVPYCAAPPERRRPSSSNSDEARYRHNPAGPIANGVVTGRSRSQSEAAATQQSPSQSQNQSQSQSQSGASHAQKPPLQLPPAESDGGVDTASADEFRAQDWSVVKVLEEYDPDNLDEVSRPHAYVSDYVVRVDLSVSIVEEIQRYEERMRAGRDPPMAGPSSDETASKKKSSKKPGWFEKLRDQLQRGEDIRWYVIVNGDEVRDFPNPEHWSDDDHPEESSPVQEEQDQDQEQTQYQNHAQYDAQQWPIINTDTPDRDVLPQRLAGKKPALPEKDNRRLAPPLLRTKVSVDSASASASASTSTGPAPALRPKTPSKAGGGRGLRRLFGKQPKTDDTSPS